MCTDQVTLGPLRHLQRGKPGRLARANYSLRNAKWVTFGEHTWVDSRECRSTSIAGPHVGWPVWSPDGDLLAFDCSVPGQRDIYVVNANWGHSSTHHY